MSEENIKSVRDAAVALNRGDLDAWLEFRTDDIDYTFRDGQIARGREYWTRDEALEAAGTAE